MNWFKNLNAMPRLMCSFGVLLVLTMVLGYLAVSSLSQANERVQGLYQEDLQGIAAIQNIAMAKMDLARQDRDATIFIHDQAVVTKDINALNADFVSMHTNLQTAQHCFRTKEGQAILAEIQDTLPKYQKGVDGIVEAIEAKDPDMANARQSAMSDLAAQMLAEINHALQLKQAASEEKFQSNNHAYQIMRAIIIGAVVTSLLVGMILSFAIARGFSVPLGHAVITLEKVAAGDLTASLDVSTKDEVGRMATALNKAVQRLNSTLQEVADSAANASASSQQLAAASEAIASGAQEQAASLEETSSSLEEISAAVRLSADNATKASDLASGSRQSTVRGHEGTSAVAAMEDISAASAKIADIISTVDEIAFQTNLLAVNAAVEAARAGDEGRGFAVVASEVRTLAQRSAGAAKEIKGLIQDSLRKVERGSELVNRVTQLVSEIAHTSVEQSTGIEQVNTAMTQMDQVTQSNSAQTEELSATADSLSEQAAQLLELIGTFTLTEGGKRQQNRNLPQHPISTLHSRSDRQQPAGNIRNNGAAKWGSTPRGSKLPKNGKLAQEVTVPSMPPLADAGFAEF